MYKENKYKDLLFWFDVNLYLALAATAVGVADLISVCAGNLPCILPI